MFLAFISLELLIGNLLNFPRRRVSRPPPLTRGPQPSALNDQEGHVTCSVTASDGVLMSHWHASGSLASRTN